MEYRWTPASIAGRGGRWCQGTYRGTVSFYKRDSANAPHRLLGRYSFRVR